MLLAYHCGLCLIDLFILKNLLRSPKKALIEETETGYEILVPPTYSSQYTVLFLLAFVMIM